MAGLAGRGAATQRVAAVVALALALVLSGAGLGGGAAAETVVVLSTKDTTLIEEVPDNGNGGSISTIVGRNQRGFERRTAIQFDLSVLEPGATVTGARLQLFITKQAPSAPTDVVALHRITQVWAEDTSLTASAGLGEPAGPDSATWNRRRNGKAWTTLGGTFVGSPSAQSSVSLGMTVLAFSSAGMVDDINLWLNNAKDNRGWMVKTTSAIGGTARLYGTSNGEPQFHPVLLLTVDGMAEEPMGACCLDLGACVLETSDDCEGEFGGEGTTCNSVMCPMVLAPFVDALPIPAIAAPTKGKPDAKATYKMTVAAMVHSFHRDLPAATVWGFNGQYPGPTIVARKGKKIKVVWRNELRDAQGALMTDHPLTGGDCVHGPSFWGTVPRFVPHLHGGVVSARSDGNPDFPILPGRQDVYVYENKQPAATLWYHDHALGITRKNVYMGLAGAWLVRNNAEDRLGLPAGEFEVPLILQDRTFSPDGTLSYPEDVGGSFLGRHNVVNGKVTPFLEVKRTKYRFRMVNGCNARTLTLSLKGHPFEVIGSDQGFLEAPLLLEELTLSPGERYDVLIDFSGVSTSKLNLINVAGVPFPYGPTDDALKKVLRFRPTGASLDPPATPQSLSTIKPIKEKWASQVRTFMLTQAATDCGFFEWAVNGRHWDDITELPALGDVEVWEFYNPSSMLHPMHLHLVSLQILSEHELEVAAGSQTVLSVGTGTPPAPEDSGWKDTIKVLPAQMVRVITRFSEYTGRFAYHCHVLEHEDHDMMRQFRVVNKAKHCNNDGVCGAKEDCVSCPNDCGTSPGAVCGNGLCEAGDGETCVSCPVDCAGTASGAFCCGLGVGCDDPRCASGSARCRAAPTLPACCGDSLCEGAETKASCGVDCDCRSIQAALGCQYS